MNNRQSSVRCDGGNNAAAPLLDAFIVAARHRGVHLSREQVLRDHQLKSPEITVPQMLRIARKAGMRGRSVRLRWQDLFKMGTALPAIAILRNGSAMVLLGARAGRPGQPDTVVLLDPSGDEDAPLTLDEVRFSDAWDGEIVLIKRDHRLRDEDRPFGMGWIIGQLLRDRRMTRDLALCAILLSVLALAPIAFWRIMIDRVMHYGSLSTFYDAVHRVRGAGRVRHRVRPSSAPDGAVPDDPGRRQDLEPYVRSAAQPSDRLFRAHADR